MIAVFNIYLIGVLIALICVVIGTALDMRNPLIRYEVTRRDVAYWCLVCFLSWLIVLFFICYFLYSLWQRYIKESVKKFKKKWKNWWDQPVYGGEE